MPPSVSQSCSFLWCHRRPKHEENCLGHNLSRMPLFCPTAGLVPPINSQVILAAALHLSLTSLTCSCTMYLPWSSFFVTIEFYVNIHTLIYACYSHCLIMVFIVNWIMFMVIFLSVSGWGVGVGHVKRVLVLSLQQPVVRMYTYWIYCEKVWEPFHYCVIHA